MHRYSVACLSVAIGALALLPLQVAVSADAPKDAAKAAAMRVENRQKLEAAQKKLDAAAREVADLSMSLAEDDMPRFMTFARTGQQRAVLGVNIGSRGGDDLPDGVEVQSISPGGAAATAGLQAGDVLTEINGKSLRRKGDESPRAQLLDAMNEVKPGEKVRVRYRRGDKTLTASVTAQAPANKMFGPAMPFPVPGEGIHGLRQFSFRMDDGVFGAVELVALTPKLGQYFGSDKGLLVVRAPTDERLKVEEGDVIADIDGRVPESAAHASRILGSYQPGEKLRVNVLRMKKRLALEVEVPADARDRGPALHDQIERRLERSHRIIEGSNTEMPGVKVMPMSPMPPVSIALRTADDTV